MKEKARLQICLQKEADIVIRFQGGCKCRTYDCQRLRQICASYTAVWRVLQPYYQHYRQRCCTGYSKVFNEVNQLVERGVPAPHLMISDRAQVVMPYHILQDTYEEARLAGKSYGSTKSGIAPFYSDKFAKIGFRSASCLTTRCWKKSCRRSAHSKMSCS